VDEAGTQTIATFNGTLLLRKRMPGKPFVQLVFREAGKDWLCLSSNIANVAKLQVGKNYRIEGIFKALGEHHYIHEPSIAPLARQIVKRRVLISMVLALVIILTATGIVLAAGRHDTPPPVVTPTVVQEPVVDTPAVTNAPTPSVDTPAPPPAPAPVASPKAVVKKAAPAPIPASTPPQTPAPTPVTPVVTPVPYCDAPIDIPYGHSTVVDDTQPAGTVVTPGVNGQQKTCYTGVSGEPGTITPVSSPIDEVITVTSTP